MKILIADDEDYTREGLIESIDWDVYGIDEIMQAVNGQEALKIAKWFQPDIVLTDIRMPKMDGIDFVAELLENNKSSQIIFMSGYMEIDYLKSAIRLNAVDYIEKPIELCVLKEALYKAVQQVKEKRKSIEAQENHREIRQQMLVSLLCTKEADMMTIEKLAGEIAFPLNTFYVCVILQHLKKDFMQDGDMAKLLELLQFRCSQTIGRYDRDKRQYQIILSYPQREQFHLMPVCMTILEAFPHTSLGLGMEAENYKSIYNSYKTAAAAVNCAFYQEEKRFFQIDETIQHRRMIEPGLYGEFLQILSSQPQLLQKWFQSVFTQLRENKYCPREQVYTFTISLTTAIYRQYPELYGEHPLVGNEEQLQTFLYDMESLREIEQFLEEVLSWIQERSEEKAGYSRIVQGTLDYVARHFSEESLSVAQIAESLHFSPAYLNVLFKQEMKITMKQYLSNYRLERAKRLLERDFDRITEIADKCGYANANYFAKVFKEATGMTPAEYRNRDRTIKKG